MKLEGEILVEAPRERVWQMLNDREVLKRHMPGCETLNEVGDEKYEAVITIGIGAIKGSYQ
ncbi:MAG: SRPBCC domain-containing protein, partial [SAR324 cluster bacterium]|nr:SRPBCC domain-containing protein [SAR324 cluster bacterium]